MAYQGGQRSAKKAPRAQGINWNPQFPAANFLFGKGPFYAGRGAAAGTMPAPTDAQLRAEGFGFGVREYDPLETGRRPGQQIAPPALALPAPVVIPAGTMQSGSIVQGVTPAGTVDRSQSDEYRSQLAQYGNLINQKKTQEAEDLGMQIWMQKYGNTPMGQAGGVIGAYNPLLANTFPETGGYAANSAPVEEVQMGDLGTRAQGEAGPTMETLNPLAAQAQQQAATAKQADKATTVKLPIRNRVQQFLYGGV